MKLTSAVDLTALRATVATKINSHYAAAALSVDRMGLLHAIKAQLVATGDLSHIAEEAAAKGVPIDALAQQIIAKSKDTTAQLVDLERSRQLVLHRLKSLTTEQQIRALVP